ncbi:helix-turn-helix transcriptional regulator [Brucella pseudogrignonensis]|uniref:Transcriptional regulator with XRE-family HTH domain n=1 Tax=Brucella pseudogrignonensis TaxID=419475 RepID=A0ABU1MCC5_9HYPH|nr:helix-turn-helix transcriptional regulator [Brucella pseudogrignonensis]MDR6433411.1 transcriptional regulator with XRE-family HTH domain [Brucella pseudogrignonensis]
MSQQDAVLPDQMNSHVAERVREEIARRRISRQQLADEARISLSTLEKALSGHRPFTLATIIRLEQAMGLKLRDKPETEKPIITTPQAHAHEDLGAYSRAAVSWLEGTFLTLRPSFGKSSDIFAYCTDIGWDSENTHLKFEERERIDTSFSQHGRVSVPHLSGHVYLVTNTSGQYRMAVLSRPSISGEMYGILTTLRAGQGAQLTPVSVPLVLIPMRVFETPVFGRVSAEDKAYDRYSGFLSRAIGDGYASFITSHQT